MQEGVKKRLYKPKNVGRLPRFPYGGTNRIRFKGYNLSRTAPPSKMLINLLLRTRHFCLARYKVMHKSSL